MKKYKKVAVITLAIVVALAAFYVIAPGFTKQGNVYIADYSVSEDSTEMNINVGVSTSIGYVRKIAEHQQHGGKLYLDCYSAFGGINGSIGAEHRFVIPLSPECKEIYLYSFGEYRLEIIKDEATGEWKSTKLPPDRF